MKLFIKHSIKIFILSAFLLLAITTTNAQTARLRFDNLKAIGDKARDVIEVNVDGNILKLAKRVLVKIKDKDGNAKKIGEAIKDLEGIYVRVFRFDNVNEYNMADVDSIRSQLQKPGWEKLANVRSKKNNQKIDVYTMFSGDVMSGVAVVISEDKSIALVNVVGPIDIELLAELGGKLNIPNMDIVIGDSGKKNDDN